MRAVQRHTEKPESQQSVGEAQPVQRHESLRGVDYTTAVQRLAPVQQKEDTANVHAAAQRGTSGGGGSLPYLAQIQKSFGQHDVSGIKSHTGGKASEACESMGAEAYASGQDVAFKGQPDLHTAAHEAAHIVQQKAGVQLSGGVGKAGDPYEKNADEVADRVVQGKSAEDLLGGPTFGGAAAVQRSVQMKGGLLDKLKAFFLEAKLTGPQQQVAKILAEKHGVDVSGLPTATFASLYNDAGGNNPKQSPDKTAANMASAARDHVGTQTKKPTQKKESGVVSGTAVQRKESRHVQRITKTTSKPAKPEKTPEKGPPKPKPKQGYTAAQIAEIRNQVAASKQNAKAHLEALNSRLKSVAQPLLSLSSAINGLVAHLEKAKGDLEVTQAWTTHIQNIGTWTTKLADAKTLATGSSDMLAAVITAPRFFGGSALELAGVSGEVGLMFGWVTSIAPFAAGWAEKGAKGGVLSLLNVVCDTANYFLAKQNEARQGQIDKLEGTLLTLKAKRTALSHAISQITAAQASITEALKKL